MLNQQPKSTSLKDISVLVICDKVNLERGVIEFNLHNFSLMAESINKLGSVSIKVNLALHQSGGV